MSILNSLVSSNIQKLKGQLNMLKSQFLLKTKNLLGEIVFIILGILSTLAFVKTYASLSISNQLNSIEITTNFLNANYFDLS